MKLLRRIALAPVNAAIWLYNAMNYFGHLETQRHSRRYVAYDFSRDVPYKS